MTEHQRGPFYTRPRQRRDGDWKPISPTVKRPGEWRQTPTGFERVPA